MNYKPVYSLKAAIRQALSDPYFYSEKEEKTSDDLENGTTGP